MPKLSVITTVFNAEAYLRESLDSVFNQDFDDFELILVNDGCTDGSRDIMIEYAGRVNVRLLENQYNEGCPFGRNRALIAATGEYVAVHDADDISLPERFSQEVEFLDKHKNVTFMGSHAIKISHTGSTLGTMHYPPPTTEDGFKCIVRYKLNPIIDPSCMFRRETILQHGGYNMDAELRTVQDFDLWCRLLAQGYHMSNIQHPLIKYRINPKSITRKERGKQIEATDLVWARFRRKNFPTVTLRRDLFEQKCCTEYERDHYV